LTTTWTVAVEAAADALGEMLMAIADGRGDPACEEMAAAVLRSGLAMLLQGPPGPARLDAVGRVLWGKLHDGDDASWAGLTPIEKAFWLDMATAATVTADAALLNEIGAGSP
jgi:hypothetical protein